MKIISTKEYNKLMKMKSDYLDLLWKPFQGVFEKVTDDDLLRENGLLNAENERLNNIINEFDKWLLGEQMMFYKSSDDERLIRYGETKNKWLELKGDDKE